MGVSLVPATTCPAFHPTNRDHPGPHKGSLTRSRAMTKVWSQDCLATGPQPVWPTTRLSTFSTASTSPARPESGLRAGQESGGGTFALPSSRGPLLTGQLASPTLLLGSAPKPALGRAPGQRGRGGTSRHCRQQLLTAQEADLQCPCRGACEGPSSDAILQRVPGTPGMLPSHGGSKPRACSPYALAATCHPGGRPTGPPLLPSLYVREEAGTQRQRSQTQTSVLSLPRTPGLGSTTPGTRAPEEQGAWPATSSRGLTQPHFLWWVPVCFANQVGSFLGSLEICPSEDRGSSGTLAALEDIHRAEEHHLGSRGLGGYTPRDLIN